MSTSIAEGNILIAGFMGCKRLIFEESNLYTYWGLDGFEDESGEYLKFHSSWDWLMPVVQKIRDTPMIKGRVLAQTSYWENIVESLLVVELDSIYLAVVSFIQWYTSLTPINKP